MFKTSVNTNVIDSSTPVRVLNPNRVKKINTIKIHKLPPQQSAIGTTDLIAVGFNPPVTAHPLQPIHKNNDQDVIIISQIKNNKNPNPTNPQPTKK